MMRRMKRSPLLKAAFLASALMAAIAFTVLILAWVPSRGGSDGEERGTASPLELPVPGGEATGKGAGDTASGHLSPGMVKVNTVKRDDGTTYVEVQLPPLSGEAGKGTEEGGAPNGIYGAWILDMEGSTMGLKGCRLELHEDGTVALPPEYASLVKVTSGGFSWQEGSPDFHARVELQATLNPGQGLAVSARLEFQGTVSADLRSISGDFEARPAQETYAALSQKGSFIMRRAE